MRAPILLALAALAVACRPALPRALVEQHPALTAARLGPVVVESSAPAVPGWVMRPDRDAVGYVDFVGQASAPDLDTARGEAMRDLLSAAANFVSVDVASSFTAVESHVNGAESQEVRSEVRTHAQAALRDVHADAFYWERLATSSIDTSQTTVRYAVRARVPRAEIQRARLQKQLDRQRGGDRALVVITPLVSTLAPQGDTTTAALARALAEDLGRSLAADPRLHVVEPAMVEAVLGQGDELDRLEAIQRALLADRVVSGTLQRSGDLLRVHYTVRRGGDDPPLASGVVEGPWARLFALEAALAEAVRRDLALDAPHPSGARQGARTLTPPGDAERWSEAERAHAEAWAAMEAGQPERAIEQARRALELRPGHAVTLLRLGRIYERLGRFGLIEQAAAQAARATLITCRPESRERAEAAVARLRERAARHTAGLGRPAWIEPTTPTTDHVLQRAALAVGGRPLEPAPEGWRPTAAASAYYSALIAARMANDLPREHEALLALAELATRVDRASAALLIDRALAQQAAATGDHHVHSLAQYGIGVALRRMGQLDLAVAALTTALEARARLGEKPYLLEIYNELAGAEVERGDLERARAWYRLAQHIADDLGADYLRAVLANNVGVLAWREGRAADAEAAFAEAEAYLVAHDDADGAIAALLNGAEAARLRGDPEAAQAKLEAASRRIEATDQEGRRASLAARRASCALISGRPLDALDQAHEALSLAVALGQAASARRAQGAVLTAEARVDVLADVDLDCLRNAHRWLAAPALAPQSPQFTAPRAARVAQAGAAELALAQDALVVEALASGVAEGTSPLRFDDVAPDGASFVERAVEEVLIVSRRVEGPARPRLPPPPPPPRYVPVPHDDSAERPPPTSPRPTAPVPVSPGTAEGGTAAQAEGQGPVDDVGARGPTGPTPRAAPYERIVGAFETEPSTLLLLTPADLPRLVHARFPEELGAVASRAEALRARRIEAAARLNFGALVWRRGAERAAYRELMRARRLFVALGDAEGLAAAHEWLGLMLRDSAATERAAENLALSRALFGRLEDARAAERVLGWTD